MASKPEPLDLPSLTDLPVQPIPIPDLPVYVSSPPSVRQRVSLFRLACQVALVTAGFMLGYVVGDTRNIVLIVSTLVTTGIVLWLGTLSWPVADSRRRTR